MKKPGAIVALSAFLTVFLAGSAYANKVQIKGNYCYQYGDSESLMVERKSHALWP